MEIDPGAGPIGYLGRLFSTLVSYIARGLGIAQAEERFVELYGALPQQTFEQTEALAAQAVANVEALLNLPAGAPLLSIMGGAAPPNPTVWVRTLQHFTDRAGNDVWRTVDIEVDWSLSASWVYAEAAEHARDIADTYNWKLVDVQIIPPLLY